MSIILRSGQNCDNLQPVLYRIVNAASAMDLEISVINIKFLQDFDRSTLLHKPNTFCRRSRLSSVLDRLFCQTGKLKKRSWQESTAACHSHSAVVRLRDGQEISGRRKPSTISALEIFWNWSDRISCQTRKSPKLSVQLQWHRSCAK